MRLFVATFLCALPVILAQEKIARKRTLAALGDNIEVLTEDLLPAGYSFYVPKSVGSDSAESLLHEPITEREFAGLRGLQASTPTRKPTNSPTVAPTRPTSSPTVEPTSAPSQPTVFPTVSPTRPTRSPTIRPTSEPTERDFGCPVPYADDSTHVSKFVTLNGKHYASIQYGLPDGTSQYPGSCDCGGLPLNFGWQIAPNDNWSLWAIKNHTWSSPFMVVDDGSLFNTLYNAESFFLVEVLCSPKPASPSTPIVKNVKCYTEPIIASYNSNLDDTVYLPQHCDTSILIYRDI